MTKKQIAILVLAAFVLFAADYFLQPGAAPPGQQAVVSLSNANFAAFQQAFDAEPGIPRLVLLLSPT
jgi:hypothetical protein